VLGLSPWLSLLAVLIAILIARRVVQDGDSAEGIGTRVENPASAGFAERVADRLLALTNARWTPAIAGLLTGALTAYAWGSLRRSAVIHDESAYLLQAKLFAGLRFTAPSPSLPRFFEQLYINLAPAISSKYPPGTSLLIAPGALVGLPGLPIVLANALTGALVFAVARRVLGGVSAALTWVLWITSYPVLYYHAMYVSEVPSSLAWIAAWWGVLHWRASGRRSGLAISAAAAALCAISRPLTAVALAISLACVLLGCLARDGALTPRAIVRAATPFLVAGALAVGFLTLWNWRSTGDPRLSPLTHYTRTYVPFDKLGFGSTVAEQPAARLPWDQRVTSNGFYQEHLIHTVPKLPLIILVRARTIAHDMWYDWRGGLAVLALVGLIGAPVAIWIGIGTLVIQLLCYLLYAHSWSWSLYYIEIQPLLAALTALGVARSCTLAARAARPGAALERRHALAVSLLLVALLYPAAVTVRQVRAQIAGDHSYYDSFARMLPRVPGGSIVFVRYAPSHNDGLSLVRNQPPLDDAPVWTVYDRGAENAQLLEQAPRRSAYLFDEATWTLRPLPRGTR
jgi:hypothetical protein